MEKRHVIALADREVAALWRAAVGIVIAGPDVRRQLGVDREVVAALRMFSLLTVGEESAKLGPAIRPRT